MMVSGLALAGAEEVVELRVLNYLDLTSPNSAEEGKIVWEAFEEAHPNIKLVIQNEYNEPFHQATEAYAAAGNLPDVMYVWPSGRSTTSAPVMPAYLPRPGVCPTTRASASSNGLSLSRSPLRPAR